MVNTAKKYIINSRKMEGICTAKKFSFISVS